MSVNGLHTMQREGWMKGSQNDDKGPRTRQSCNSLPFCQLIQAFQLPLPRSAATRASKTTTGVGALSSNFMSCSRAFKSERAPLNRRAAQWGVDRVPCRSANPVQWLVADCLQIRNSRRVSHEQHDFLQQRSADEREMTLGVLPQSQQPWRGVRGEMPIHSLLG